jgi:2-amino-4-ketopentanoate thiolase alpha subunit
MTDAARCTMGEWVEVERVLLEPADRSANLPPETAEKPMLVWVAGFAGAEADLGEQLTVETVTGRFVTGRLSAVNPGYFHTFGNPVPELIGVGRDLKARVAAYRKAGE